MNGTRHRAGVSTLCALLSVATLALACDRRAPLDPPAVEVVAIYPTAELIPANQLKLYIEFSGPMTMRRPYDHLRLVDDATGEELEAVFHAMRDGLWDSEGRRLTVLFDPGRIKRGLANHEALGLPLEAGRSYRLEISGDWPDAYGRPLAGGHVKLFTATLPDRRQPSPAEWLLSAPAAGSLEPLVIEFGEPLDAALVGRALAIVGPGDTRPGFETRLGRHEASCELWPAAPWRPGGYELIVDRRLEDLAGNNLVRLFDTDLEAAPQATAPTPLRFEITQRPSLFARLQPSPSKETP